MTKRNICLMNDSFPPVIDGVANAVTNYARNIQKDYGTATAPSPPPFWRVWCATASAFP